MNFLTSGRLRWVRLGMLITMLVSLSSASAQVQPNAPQPTSVDAATAEKPNILVFMIDDLDEATFNAMLDMGLLPNIKGQLIDKGMRFTNSFVSDSACCPSRATFFTGQYPHNHHVRNVMGAEGGYGAFISANEGGAARLTLARLLKQADATYQTGYFGKFMNGVGGSSPVPAGWNSFQGLAAAGGQDLYGTMPGTYAILNGPPSSPSVSYPNTYQTKYLGDQATQFITATIGTNMPFFTVLAPTSPHVEATFNSAASYPAASQQWQERLRPDGYLPNSSGYSATLDYTHTLFPISSCNGVLPAGCLRAQLIKDSSTPTTTTVTLGNGIVSSFDTEFYKTIRLNETTACGTHKPQWICDNMNGLKLSWPEISSNIDNEKGLKTLQLDRMESMLSIDVMVGKVITAMDQSIASHSVTRDTLVVFTSDNGYLLGQHRLGNKIPAYEESIRVPLLIRTNSTPASSRTSDKLAVNIDLAPTILDYAGVNYTQTFISNDTTDVLTMDGRSLKPIIGNTNPVWRDWFIIEQRAVRAVNNSGQIDYKWWDVPDFTAVRTRIDGSTAWGNQLLVQYDSNQFPNNLDTQREHYNITNDLLELTNLMVAPPTITHTQTVNVLQWAMDGLKTCAGARCRTNDTAILGQLLTSVPRYVASPGPCYGLTGASCIFASRSYVADSQGNLIESIMTPDGKYYNYNGNTLIASGIVKDVARYKNAAGTNVDPCDTITSDTAFTNVTRNPCVFEVRSHLATAGGTLETIFSQGRAFNYLNGTPTSIYGQSIRTFTKYDTMCDDAGVTPGSQCIVDTRTFFTANSQSIESITLKGRLFQFNPNGSAYSVNNVDLRSIPQYATGPCSYAPANQPCTFDSRVFVTINGQQVESITAYGRYFNVVGAYAW